MGGSESGSDQVRFAPGRQSHPSISREVPGYGSFCLFGFWLLLCVICLEQNSLIRDRSLGINERKNEPEDKERIE